MQRGTLHRPPLEILKISGKCRGTFRAPCPTRFLGRLGGRASGPISCCCNDMPSEHGRLERTPRIAKSGTKWDFYSEIPASVHSSDLAVLGLELARDCLLCASAGSRVS